MACFVHFERYFLSVSCQKCCIFLPGGDLVDIEDALFGNNEYGTLLE